MPHRPRSPRSRKPPFSLQAKHLRPDLFRGHATRLQRRDHCSRHPGWTAYIHDAIVEVRRQPQQSRGREPRLAAGLAPAVLADEVVDLNAIAFAEAIELFLEHEIALAM